MKYFLSITFSLLVLTAAQLAAVTPATNLFLPSVGRGQGACPQGVCSLWRSDVWIFNLDDAVPAEVEIAFLVRGSENPDPATVNLSIPAGQSVELADVLQSEFGLDGVFGAFHLLSDREIAVTSRIYDANVQTNTGSGSAGQFFAGLEAAQALQEGGSTELIGLARENDWRTNFGLVETIGQDVSVQAVLYDQEGNLLAEKVINLSGFGAGQLSLSTLGGVAGGNLRLHVEVLSGPGRVLAFASRIDNRTGDPSTIEMITRSGVHTSGVFAGTINTPDGLRTDGGVELKLDEEGLRNFSGTSGITCAEYEFTVDFGGAEGAAIPFGSDGSFTAELEQEYTENGATLFSIRWTINGVGDENGIIHGTLSDEVYDAGGSWTACVGTEQRPFTAAWTGKEGG